MTKQCLSIGDQILLVRSGSEVGHGRCKWTRSRVKDYNNHIFISINFRLVFIFIRRCDFIRCSKLDSALVKYHKAHNKVSQSRQEIESGKKYVHRIIGLFLPIPFFFYFFSSNDLIFGDLLSLVQSKWERMGRITTYFLTYLCKYFDSKIY